MKRPVLIISHRRSGTHFLWEALKINFKLTERYDRKNNLITFKTHTPFSNEYFDEVVKSRTCIYLIRDARDTLVSNYYYWKAGREPYFGVSGAFNTLSFSQYLRGEVLNSEEMFSDPVKHWLSYTEWANKVFTVKFEDLKTDYEKTVINTGLYIGKRVIGGVVKPVTSLVGHAPRSGIVGDWKNHFSRDDLEYFWSIAGEKMIEFGYEKDDGHLPEVVITKPAPELESLFKRFFKRIKGFYKRG